MGQLAAGIAHEVNNPLGVVLLYSNLLIDEIEKDSQLYHDIKLISEQAERCKNIVGGLLNFARKNDVNYEKTDIPELIESVLRGIIKPDNVIFEIINEGSSDNADIDREQIKQVLTNLVKNSVEAVEEKGGEVKITIGGSEKDLVIKISDNGLGIPAENMDKLFVPFFTTKPAGKGTGLGLPVSYGIIKMHKGQINVVSNSSSVKGPTGTTFTITLPRKKPEY
jgi:signal transduction histidine kinase